MRKLKDMFPEAELTVLAAPASQQLAPLEPAIDRVIPFAFFNPRSQLGRVEVGDESVAALKAELGACAFDLAVDLRKQPDTRELLQLSGARLLAGFDFQNRFPWLDIALTWDGDTQIVHKRQHTCDDLVDLVDAVAAAATAERSTIRRGSDWKKQRRAMEQRFADIGLYRRRVVCVHPAAGNETKQWPRRYFADLINALLASEDVNFALIGGPDEQKLAREVLQYVDDADRVFDLVGKMKLDELPYFLDTCALFIGNDSGPKHIAAGIGVPTIGIHSGVVDAREWGPMGELAFAVQRDMTCSPCYLANYEDCYRGLACLKGLDVSHLVGTSRKLLRLDRDVRAT